MTYTRCVVSGHKRNQAKTDSFPLTLASTPLYLNLEFFVIFGTIFALSFLEESLHEYVEYNWPDDGVC